MTCELLSQVRESFPELQQATQVTFWSDVGPHFRTYIVLGYLAKIWFPWLGCNLRICFFCEKHGKGECDAMFSHFQKWVGSYLRQTDAIIRSEADLLKVCQTGAEQDAEREGLDKGAVQWHVRHFESARKPEEVWRLRCAFSITKTYCLELQPMFGNRRAYPQIRNFVFADMLEGESEPVVLETELVAPCLQTAL